ncbi:biotin synthase [Peptoclostridium litorale DSM 5388]|uniref:3-methylornithine synthase PylB n=1 Tax=Peptoclostridium litorale DSM 5388 TaxID=1121324 RepID=A0A069RDK6_PEPLI|nr:[FeFe] hydrogenase H-cluster radical SAM maturase HydE [Peptoclostridium litorale]KDR94848.1 3-methylornithine synthase PylB [Peptoclostridium litorale DSM 5388]SIN94020.1 biotin synthase [Peptoclostridium litorale DSM 5388]
MEDKAIIEKIIRSSNASIEEIVQLLEGDEKLLFESADKLRSKYCGEEVHLRAIIEFSNHCRCDCQYCGLQRLNEKIKRYRMSPNEIVQNVKEAHDAGYKTVVLQSGEDSYYTREIISDIIRDIKKIGDIAITLSVGERDYEDYAQWKKDGADRFLLKHETADPNIYDMLHPHSSFERRLQCLRWLKELGYQTGSGFMIGLPGQSLETIAMDILLLSELDVEMAGIGPFIPHPDTGLNHENTGSSLLTLKAVAITRLMLKRPHLPTTTALEVSTGTNAFCAGANVIMRKVEPHRYRRLYEIYPKPEGSEKTILEERREVVDYIKSFGRVVSDSRGDAIEIKK